MLCMAQSFDETVNTFYDYCRTAISLFTTVESRGGAGHCNDHSLNELYPTKSKHWMQRLTDRKLKSK